MGPFKSLFFCQGWGENDRGVSFTFGADVVSKFLNRHDLDLICRAHQVRLCSLYSILTRYLNLFLGFLHRYVLHDQELQFEKSCAQVCILIIMYLMKSPFRYL